MSLNRTSRSQQTLLSILGVVAAISLLGACASPNWSGMSETEIASWKAAGADAGLAKNWIKKGFSAEDYTAWTKAGFDLKHAAKWKKDEFTASEAAEWSKSGFSLDDAKNSRDKGLMPIHEQATKAGDALEAAAGDAAKSMDAASGAATDAAAKGAEAATGAAADATK